MLPPLIAVLFLITVQLELGVTFMKGHASLVGYFTKRVAYDQLFLS